jgi:hypothetical protein
MKRIHTQRAAKKVYDFMTTIRRSPRFFLLVVLLPLALLTSCAHTQRYAEPNLPPNELATLEVTAPVWIVSLDGGSVSSSVFSDRTRIRILPGPHRVELAYQHTNIHTAPAPQLNGAVFNAGEISSSIHENTQVTTYSLHNVPLDFVAKPGFTYFIEAGISAKTWNPTIGESPRQ